VAQPSRIERAQAAEAPAADPRIPELLRRIEELEALDESQLGPFTAWDWLACALAALAVPAAVLWWFGR
jgi:hypothetical protein